jgi:hypothetical protein
MKINAIIEAAQKEGTMDELIPERACELLGTPEEIAREIAQHRRDEEFLQERWKKLLAEHPDKWVVVLDEAIIGFADNPGDAAKMLAENRGRGVLRRLDPDPRPLILASS